MPTYNPKDIEPRWQSYWEHNETFATPDVSDKPKYYILDMFPYPSGSGLHVGHPEGYTATDILARYKRMLGFNVLHPMGWDAFGLPAEEHARQTGEHPRIQTRQNIDNFRRQIKMLGFSYDWQREVDTTDPNYFKWTQWIFLQLFDTWYDPKKQKGRPISELPIPKDIKDQGEDAARQYRDSKRLAYQAEIPVNWCAELGTVLANEEVIDGKSERGGHPVERMPLRQWMLRITDYAERLLDDLEIVAWPEPIKEMQRNWIGKSIGAEADFTLAEPPEGIDDPNIRVFTTRPDTLFGATYMVLAPEHPLVDKITTKKQQNAVAKYKRGAAFKSDLERTELSKEKTGVFTGAYAINPVNDEKIPIWIADYVLISYGTGAIMAVPAHDLRDWEFAREFDLPIRPVAEPPKDYQPSKEELAVAYEEDGKTHYPFAGEGKAINSGEFDGLPSMKFKKKITDWLDKQGKGNRKVNYKLRDWLFSRQRYWGEPFPILHEVDADGKPTGVIRTVPEEELPLCLPDLEDYKPSGKPEPPLGKATEWINVTLDGKTYRRETNTMPQWAGSCWYYLRYIDAKNDKQFCDPEKEKYWMPIDLYVGGAEHAVLHLLYARFWHKVLFDRGHVSSPEPFGRLVNQGMILGEMEYTGFKSKGKWISAEKVDADTAKDKKTGTQYDREKFDEDQVEKKGEGFVLKDDAKIRVDARAYKMSKSRGNVINPDDVVEQYGADSLRLYEMFMGPLEATKPWSMRGVEGVYRFLNRVWRLIVDDNAEEATLLPEVQDAEPSVETKRRLHQTIKKVTDDLDAMRFNTAIAAMMELLKYLNKVAVRPKAVVETLVLLLSPFAPHMAEELWSILGHDDRLAYEPWPKWEEKWTKEDEVTVPIQINGKLRSKITVPADTDKDALEATAMADEKVQGIIDGKQIRKVIVIPKKMVNIVVS